MKRIEWYTKCPCYTEMKKKKTAAAYNINEGNNKKKAN